MTDEKRISLWINTVLEQVSKLDKEQGIEVLHQCGAACTQTADLLNGAASIRESFARDTDVDTLFQAFRSQHYNRPGLTKQGDTITLVFQECTCPLVAQGVSHPALCNCTAGYSKKIFETLLGRPIDVNLEQTILRGDEICKQIITFKDG